MPNWNMKRLLIRAFVTLLLFIIQGAIGIRGQVPVIDEPADLDTELNTPAVPGKMAGALRRVMNPKAQSLIDQGFNVELMRDEQVIAVTIQLDDIFDPNEINLNDKGSQQMQAFLPFTRHYGFYKILLVVHSDDTGSKYYKDWLCEQRIISLYDFFDAHNSTPAIVYGYPMADKEPIENNDTRTHRAINRRLEVYIVPGPQLIQDLKNKK